jgi:hypothetical protein
MFYVTNLYNKSDNLLKKSHFEYLTKVNTYDNIQLTVLLFTQAVKLYLFYFVFYKYMKSLDESKCECATKHKFHKYLKYFFYIMNIVIIYNMLINIMRLFGFKVVTPLAVFVIQTLMVILSIISLIFVLFYLNDTEKCECAQQQDRNLLYIFSIIALSITSIILLFPLIKIFVASYLSLIDI